MSTPSGSATGGVSSYAGLVMAAPMVRVSHLGFRMLCAANGADVVFGEEIVANRIARCVVERRRWRSNETEILAAAQRSEVVEGATGVGRPEGKLTGETGPLPVPGGGTMMNTTTCAADVLADIELIEFVDYEIRKPPMAKRSIIFQTLRLIVPDDSGLALVHSDASVPPSAISPANTSSSLSAEGAPVIFQLGAADPVMAAKAATRVAPFVDGIDVNMGCPKKFSVNNGMGAALMRDRQRACDIVRAIREAVGPGVPVSVKTRMQPTAQATVSFLAAVVEAGALHSVTLHARFVDQKSESPPQYELAKEVAELWRVQFPRGAPALIFNGSLGLLAPDSPRPVVSSCDATALPLAPFPLLATAQHFGFDGALVARGAMSNPACFRYKHALPEATSNAVSDNSNVTPIARDLLRCAIRFQTHFSVMKYHLTRVFQEWQYVSAEYLHIYQACTRAKNYFDFSVALRFSIDEQLSVFRPFDVWRAEHEVSSDKLVVAPASVVQEKRAARNDDDSADKPPSLGRRTETIP